MAEQTRQKTFRLPNDLYLRVVAQAKREDRSFAQIVRHALEKIIAASPTV